MVPMTYYFQYRTQRSQTRMQLTYSSYALSTETFVTMSQCLSSYAADKTYINATRCNTSFLHATLMQ